MQITKGRVTGGRIIVEGDPLPEGGEVTVLYDNEACFELSAEDEATLLIAMAEAGRGETLDTSEVLSQSRKR